MKTCYTAIFGQYDDLKDPIIVTPGWRYICFTDQPFQSQVWQVVQRPMMPEGAKRTARYYKIMFHRHIEDEYSLWVDGSFVINCDLNKWWERFREPMTCIRHPLRSCVYKEAQACIDQRRDVAAIIQKQIDNYRVFGVPENNGLIQSGLIMRKLSQTVINLCDIWWQHLSLYSVRDQLSFAFASWRVPGHYVIEYDYSRENDFLYLYHLHSPKRATKIAHYKSLNLLK